MIPVADVKAIIDVVNAMEMIPSVVFAANEKKR